MKIEEQRWAEIPVLYVAEESMDTNTPLVFFLHGHMSAKEHNLHYAFQLVKNGVRVVLPDAIYHGERTTNLSETEYNLKFWDIVFQSIKELHILYTFANEQGILNTNKVGVMGSSMGGITTSAALTKYDWIQSAAICMGVTSVSKLAEHQLQTIKISGQPLVLSDEQKAQATAYLQALDLEKYPEIFTTTPIIFWHGEQDHLVPMKFSYPYFEQNLTKTKAEYVKEEKASHKVSRNGVLKVTKFVAQHLSE